MSSPRPTIAVLMCLTAGVLALAGPAVAQPKVYVSPFADLPTGRAPTEKEFVSDFGLRPNADQTFYVYVQNPAGADPLPALTVLVTDDEKREGRRLAEGAIPAGLKGGETIRVALKGVGAAAEPPPPTAPPAAAQPAAAGDKPLPPPPKPGVQAPARIFVHLLNPAKEPVRGYTPEPMIVSRRTPNSYIDATLTQERLQDGGVKVTVTLSANDNFRPGWKPATAQLDVRPALIPGLDPASARDGTFETVIAPGDKGVELVANSLRPRPGRTLDGGIVAVTIDGFNRAYAFLTDFGGTDPQPSAVTFFRIGAPEYAVPGQPAAARVEVFNDPPQLRAEPKLRFYRSRPDARPEQVMPNQNTTRDIQVLLRVGAEGGLAFSYDVKDWVVPLNTKGLQGPRRLDLTLELPKDGAKLPEVAPGRYDELKRFLATFFPETTDPTLGPDPVSPIGYLQPLPGQGPQVPAVAKLILDATPPLFAPPPLGFGAVPVPPLAKPVKEDEPLDPTPPVPPPPTLTDIVQGLAGGACRPGCDPTLLLPGIPGAEKALRAAAAAAEAAKKGPPVLVFWPPFPDRPVRVLKGSAVLLVARAADPESGIDDEVRPPVFFLGSPPLPDGKPAPNSRIAGPNPGPYYVADPAEGFRWFKAGEEVPEATVYILDPVRGLVPVDVKKVDAKTTATMYAAVLPLPEEKGRVQVGVRMFNRAGLSTDQLGEIIIDEPPPPPTTGTIAGRVVQGSGVPRPQPGLPVQLLTPDGKPVASAVTDPTGAFVFPGLKPGPYLVYSVKSADQNAQSFATTTVVAGKRTDVVLEIKR